MANTFSFTPFSTDSRPTVAQINSMFAAIQAVMDEKLDVRGDTLGGNIETAVGTGISVINILPESEMEAAPWPSV